jgi:plasmid replication initiation protein
MYSWRLLEILTTYGKDKGAATFEISDFHHAMETPKSVKSNFGELRRRIIEPAVKELREKDSWLIDWEPIKRGRKVQQIRFRYVRNPQGSLF